MHSYNKIWLHVIFATKERCPIIQFTVETKIYAHMREQLIELGCPVRIINGMPDHVHLLFLQNPKMAIADVVKQVKGNTSHWVNEQDLIAEKFSWQTGYAAYSDSESQLEKVYQYIYHQKEHHKIKSFQMEFDEFIALHGLQKEE